MNDNKIVNFSGKNKFLSNFFRYPFEYNGLIFKTSEHAYQYEKALLENEKYSILHAGTASECKILGHKCTMVDNWDNIKFDKMYNILKSKFAVEKLRTKLLDTGTSMLVEENYWHDNIWGDCICKKCITRNGANNLGKILMRIRAEHIHILNS